MFGEEWKERPETGANIQHSTSNIQHSREEAERGRSLVFGEEGLETGGAVEGSLRNEQRKKRE